MLLQGYDGKITIYGLVIFYLRVGSLSKVQKLLTKITNEIPVEQRTQVLLIGDFNIDLNDKDNNSLILLQKCCKDLGLFIENPGGPTREKAILDFLIRGKNITAEKRIIIPSLSNHKAITWDLKVNLPQKVKPTTIPSRKCAQMITQTSRM